MSYFRTISSARDDLTGQPVYAFELFSNAKAGFAERRAYHTNEKSYSCLECDQRLVIATSSKDRVFFRHLPNSNFCELKDSSHTPAIRNDYYRFLHDRESDRHKELKSIIGEGLQAVSGVDIPSIAVDTEFIIKGDGRRRPDVYCKYKGREIVFEIQLSPLSLRFILGRYNFYRKHGIYLFWILDSRTHSVQQQMEKDIKYLFPHQNLMAVVEQSKELQLNCRYKASFIHDETSVRDVWKNVTLRLSDLHFDETMVQAYYWNHEVHHKSEEERLNKILADKIKLEEERRKAEKAKLSEVKILGIISEILCLKEKDYSFYNLLARCGALDDDEVELLNDKLGLVHKSKDGLSAINYYIRNYRNFNPHYENSRITLVEFLLTAKCIKIDVNVTEEGGSGCLQEIYNNQHLNPWVYRLLPALFSRDYRLTDQDQKFIDETPMIDAGMRETEWLKLTYYNRLSDKSMLPLILKHFGYLIFIESAIQKRMIGTKLKSWVQFVVWHMGKNKRFWYYSRRALTVNGAWDVLISSDRKGTIAKKINEFELDTIDVDDSIAAVLNDLFPEAFLV